MANRRGKRLEFSEKLLIFFAEFGVYLFCVAGVFISKYIPVFREGGVTELSFDTFTIVMSCFIGLMISFTMDLGGDREDQIKNWKRRAAFALTNGAMWYTIIGG